MNRQIAALLKAPAYLLVTFSLVLLTIAMLFLTYTNSRLVKQANDNRQTLSIVKAATGCQETQTVRQCQTKLAEQQTISFQQFLVLHNKANITALECFRASKTDAELEACISNR